MEATQQLSVEVVVIQKTFMQNFDLDLVTYPGQDYHEKYVKGQHPQWKDFKGTKQFVDPIIDDSIAYWNEKYFMAFFFGKGAYLKKNPRVENDYTWIIDPREEPYKTIQPRKGKQAYVIFFCHLKSIVL